jgi:hypothetical protein
VCLEWCFVIGSGSAAFRSSNSGGQPMIVRWGGSKYGIEMKKVCCFGNDRYGGDVWVDNVR